MLVHYFADLPVPISFATCRGSTISLIDIRMRYEALGADKRAELFHFYAFTGCDQTRKFCGKSKLTCWKVYSPANENIISVFKRLGDNEDDTRDSSRKELCYYY